MRTPHLRADVPLAPYTTFGIGGPARLLADVAAAEQLRQAVLWAERRELPWTVLGRGSNVLVGDDGFDGLVIRNVRSTQFELLPGNRVRAESGVAIERLLTATVALGRLRESGALLLDATLQLMPGDPVALRETVRANLAWRAERHPAAAATRSAGCVFRNPPGSSAAHAIDSAGLKGLRVGGAVVSRRHANFILNAGGATASDVHALIQIVAERVARHSGISLEPELAFLG